MAYTTIVAVFLVALTIVSPSKASATTFNVTVTGTGNGVVSGSGIDCDKGKTAGHETCVAAGTSVELTAAEESGSAFTGWTVSAGGQTPNPCGTSLTCKVTLLFGTSNIAATFDISLPAPDVTIQGPSDVASERATFHGTVDPNGNDARWHFEYRPVGALTWTNAPVPDGDAGADIVPEPVEVTVGSLEPHTAYEVRLHAANASTSDTSGVESFTTSGTLPTVGTVTAWSVSDTRATLVATVDPRKAEVVGCHFEYGPTTAYGSSAPCSTRPGSGNEAVQVTAAVEALAPGATYHLRLVAVNECEEGCGRTEGTDSTVVTRSSAETTLPKRGYELVSGDTNGLPPFPFESSTDGDRYVYFTYSASPGSRSGATSYFRASRLPDGSWTPPEPIGAPAPPPGELVQLALTLFSAESLSVAAFAGQTGWSPVDQNEATDAYVDDLSGGGELEGGRLEWISRNPLIPAGVPQTDPAPIDQNIYYVSPSGDQVIFGSKRRLLPGDVAAGAATSLYSWTKGSGLTLVSRVPASGSSCDDASATLCIGASSTAMLGSGFGSAVGPCGCEGPFGVFQNAVSQDGQRIVFTTIRPGSPQQQVYVRIAGTRTVQVSRNDPSSMEILAPFQVHYEGADAEVTKVFFTSSSALTTDSSAPNTTGGPTDLYVYELSTRTVRDLTPSPVVPGESGGAGVTHVLDVSNDGRRVYFTSSRRLAEGGEEGGSNLYLAELAPDGSAHLTFIADAPLDLRPAPGVGSSNVSFREVSANPEGSVLAFRSSASLVPGRSSGGFSQVYAYDARRHELSCPSCPSSGAAPIGAANLTPSLPAPGITDESIAGPFGSGATAESAPHTRNVSSDGTVFFQTVTSLLPEDRNGHIDVYEYRGGQLALVTPGTGTQYSSFADASADGSTVFFQSTEALVPGAQVGVRHIYAARVDGGFTPGAESATCEGGDCRGPSGPVPVGRQPASNLFQGPGNPVRASGKSRKCAKGTHKVNRKGKVRCAKRAKHRHRARRGQHRPGHKGKQRAPRSVLREGRRTTR